jgi:16S rRNA (cytidine1402-2'-O)-methyltransferase
MKKAIGVKLSSLILVTLPIGNTKDITFRAFEALKEASTIYAEDTRVLKELLKDYGIDYSNKYIDSYHDQSQGKISLIINKLKNSEDVYLVSDAGSPLISDPAYPLIQEVLKNDLKIQTLPGVTAVVTALELSGLPPHPFHFWGFVARTSNEKRDVFKQLKAIKGTHLFYESPHRVFDTIRDFFEVYPTGILIVARELTKNYESIYRLSIDDLVDLEKNVVGKGEFVILFHIETVDQNQIYDDELIAMARNYLDEKSSPKKLAKILSKILGEDTKSIYDQMTNSIKN